MQRIEHKIKKITKIIGERSVFTIGVDSKNNKMDIISIEVCVPEGIKQLQEKEMVIDYVG